MPVFERAPVLGAFSYCRGVTTIPRNGSGIYSKPAGTTANPNTTIESAKYNATIDDLVQDANAARPIVAGGTGGNSVASAQSGLQLDNKVVYASKSSGYTALATDNNAVHRYTAAVTVALTAAATLGANWHYTVTADGGAVTIDPNGSETINGLATLTVPNGSSCTIICDGSNFFTVIKPQQWVPIGGVVDLAGLSNYAWTNLAAYRDLRLRVAGAPSGTTGIAFLRVSSNNGSGYDAGANNYTNAHSVTEGTASNGVASVLSTSFPLGNVGFDSQPFEFNVTVSEWNKAAVTSFDSKGYFGNPSSGARRLQNAFGVRDSTTAFDALLLAISVGTFTRGYAILEGVVG